MRAPSWKIVVHAYGIRCCACGARKAPEELTRDHILPRSKGGTLSLANIQPLCLACNQYKADNTIDYRPLALAHFGPLPRWQRDALSRTTMAMITGPRKHTARREWQRQNWERLKAFLDARAPVGSDGQA